MEELTFLNLLILSLAVYRLSSLFAFEDGPFSMFQKLRGFTGVVLDEDDEQEGTNEVSKAIICPFCNSLWISLGLIAFFFLIPNITIILALPFALSAPTCLINEVI